MTDAERIADLENRVAELEASNAALWKWVKTLPVQDGMLIELMLGLHQPRGDDWPERRERMVNQIIDNSRMVQGLPMEGPDEQ